MFEEKADKENQQAVSLNMSHTCTVNSNGIIMAEALKSSYPSSSVVTKMESDAIYCFKSYPSTSELNHVATQMIKRWPFLSKGVSVIIVSYLYVHCIHATFFVFGDILWLDFMRR